MGDLFRFGQRNVLSSIVGAVGVIFLALGYLDQADKIATTFQPWALQATGAALFIVAVVMVLVRWDKEHGTQTVSTEQSPSAQAATTEVRSPDPVESLSSTSSGAVEGRIILGANIRPMDLMKMCVGKTDVHASRAVSSYIGKWMKHRGKVADVTIMFEMLMIRFEPDGRGTINATTRKNLEIADVLHVGDAIEVIGRIRKITEFGVQLEDAEVISR